VIDLHSHPLAGIDDGPVDAEGTAALARAAYDTGTRTIVATPHVSLAWPNTPATIRAAADAATRAVRDDGNPIEIVTGAEIAVAVAMDLAPEALAALSLGGGGALLLEPPLGPAGVGFDLVVRRLQLLGHRVVLAHPERCPTLRRDAALLRALVSDGVLCSVTAASFAGRFGRDARRFSHWMLEHDLIHDVASDAHDVIRRPPALREPLLSEVPGLGGVLDWLTIDVPRAVLDGAPLPPRVPSPQRARGRWSL
jgi:protein-tyrosine phosphatase